MKNKRPRIKTPNQMRLIKYIQDKQAVSIASIQKGLSYSYFKAVELIAYLVRENVIPDEKPRQIDNSMLEKPSKGT